jgi:hypothetical protein
MNALLLERHNWETSGAEHQIQIPKAAFAQFFGSPGSRNINVFVPPTSSGQRRTVLLSYYSDSDTYRFNWMTEFGSLGHAVLVFEETGNATTPYDVWWFLGADADAILARPYPWQQAKASQHGLGRKWVVIPVPAPRAP